MDIFQQIILGIIQGITEWIPISSDGALFFVITNFFGGHDIELFVRQALFLHLGTFFAALIYLREDVKTLFLGMKNYRHADPETKKILKFLLISTIISGIIGLAILTLLDLVNIEELPLTNAWLNIFLGILVGITGLLQIKVSKAGYKKAYHLTTEDGIYQGVAQGIAALPGLSRSGLTISTFIFRNFDETTALRLSFLMSLPIVLLGNILLNFRDIALVKGMIIGVLVSFAFGILMIHLMMEFSKRVRFGYFALTMGILLVIAGITGFFF